MAIATTNARSFSPNCHVSYLGSYRPDGRSLAIVEGHAALVRHVFARYLVLGDVSLLADELRRANTGVPRRERVTGTHVGGGTFPRGQLYYLLKNPIYTGRIAHRNQIYPGNHPAIIDAETFASVQAMLNDHTRGTRRAREASPSLLAGKVIDAAGEPLIAAHATKSQVRYRYYVSRALHHGGSASGIRVPARALEAVVTERVTRELADPLALAERARLSLAPEDMMRLHGLTATTIGKGAAIGLIEQVVLHARSIEIRCSTAAIAVQLGLASTSDRTSVTLVSDARLASKGYGAPRASGRSRRTRRPLARSSSTIGRGMLPQPTPALSSMCLAPRSPSRQVRGLSTPKSRPRV